MNLQKIQQKLGIYALLLRISEEILDYATFIAKSNELSIIFGEESREKFLRKYPNKLFVRDDANSTIYHNGSEMKYHRNDPEDMPNKMGMGDAFTSGFSIALCHGNEIDDCVKFGNDVSLKWHKKEVLKQDCPN
jgi:ribokinase